MKSSVYYRAWMGRNWRVSILPGIILIQCVMTLSYFLRLHRDPVVVGMVAWDDPAGVTQVIKKDSIHHIHTVLPWSRKLDPLSPMAVQRINQMRNSLSMHDLGVMDFFDPKVPDEIEASMMHCTKTDFDVEDALFIVTTVDSSALHQMNPYLSMISERSHGDVTVLLIAVGIRYDRIEMLCEYVKQEEMTMAVHVVLLPRSTMDGFFKYENQKHGILPHVPVATMARLLLPSLMGDIVDTILYLDIDIILAESLNLNSSLIQDMCPEYKRVVSHGVCARESLQSNIRAWCDPQTVNVLGLEEVQRGFNAGVLILSLARMKEYGFSRFASVVSQTLGVNDQVIFVAYTKDSFSRMEQKFNVFDGQDDENDGEIVHFAGQMNKPWNSWSRGHTTWRSYDHARYIFVWPSFTSIPDSIVDSLVKHSHGRTISVYCSGVVCYNQVSTVGYPLIAEDILDLRKIMRTDTPLTGFFTRLQLYKILMEESFPGIWSMALRLTVLYNKGGLLLPPSARMIQGIPDDHISGHVDFWFGESRDPQDFVLFSKAKNTKLMKVMWKFMDKIENSCFELAQNGNDTSCKNILSASLFQRKSSSFKYYDYFEEYHKGSVQGQHYSVLWYDTRVRNSQVAGTNLAANIGDEIQSLASVSWLPFVDVRVERDDLWAHSSGNFPEGSITTFMNAWYGSSGMKWPPSKSINPILLAMHLEPSAYDIFSSEPSLAFFRDGSSVVGARDTSTESFLADKGIRTFFSGCMTLTMYPVGSHTKNETPVCEYMIVDISQGAHQLLPEKVKQNTACTVSHHLEGDVDTIFNAHNRFITAFKMLERYSSAKVVITSRLHAALPACSLGVTVIMIQSQSLPGGGPGIHNMRFSGLDTIFFTVEENSIQSQLNNFTWDNPPGNPGAHLIQEFRCIIQKFIKRYHEDLTDAIRLFDLHGIFDTCS